MATTQVYANGDGTTIDFSFSFSYLKTEDIKVELQEINPNGRFISSVVVTDFTVPTNNPTQIQFNTLSASTNYQTVLGAPLTNHAVNPANTIRVKIYRETNDDAVPSTFFSGSAIRAQDLNNNFDQNLYLYQELENEAVKADGGVVTGNITFDQVVTINKVPSEATDAVNVAYLEQFVGGDSATVNTTRYREIATQGQTTVTVSPTFAVGNEVVFINGVTLSKFIEYSTPNGSTVVFTTALRAGDVIDVISYNNILVVSGDPSFDEPPFSRNAFIATAGQTVFVCTEEYTIGKEQVFLNGALLKRGVDYTAINKVNVTLTVAALVGDLVEVHSGNYFASGISSVSNSAYTYPGGVEQTVQARLEQRVSVKDFGAVGDGVTDDTAAIEAALAAADAMDPKGAVFFPQGTYFQAGTSSGNGYSVPAGVKVYGNNDATITAEGYPYMYLSDDCTLSGINFKGDRNGQAKNTVRIGVIVNGDNIVIRNCEFESGDGVITFYDSTNVLIEGNKFFNTGYQVIQRFGKVSNNVTVTGNLSEGCWRDFVELNAIDSGTGNITTTTYNWTISNNVVRNVADPVYGVDTTNTEGRFFGGTSCDGVTITGNVIDTIAGDSAVHLEARMKNVTVVGNVFRNCHSTFGKILFVPSGGDVEGLNFSDNVVRYDTDFVNWSGEGDKLIRIDSSSATRLVMSNNTFKNDSVETMSLGRFSFVNEAVFSNNFVYGLDQGIITGRGDESSFYVTGNLFEQMSAAVEIEDGGASGRNYNVFIDGNSFNNVTEVYTGAVPPVLLKNNNCKNTTNIDEARIIGQILQVSEVDNNYLTGGATTTAKDLQAYTDTGVAKVIYSVAQLGNGFQRLGSFVIVVKSSSSTTSLTSNNSTIKVVRINNISPSKTTLTELVSDNSGTGADFTLALNGTDLTFSAASAMSASVTLEQRVFKNHTPDSLAST